MDSTQMQHAAAVAVVELKSKNDFNACSITVTLS
jgi:hypothetical protein